ncbi:radical SAM/SPASM domain-containing protein [Paenibacillus maysiensis]|uniref:radical SAM/SPASM domain-containing protein n=1 Tax=Paenibacillus maysiensis TaxID=1155954 RepID=UPI000470B05C|nr:radical SAM protein [Paenibacillus maysiensis]
MTQNVQWKPSRFNARTAVDDGGLMLFNSYTGALAVFGPEENQQVVALLDARPDDPVPESSLSLQEQLLQHGFLVNAATDELKQAEELHQSVQQQNSMHLVLLATEACNFRCFYCYESFPRATMKNHVVSGLEAYIQQQAQSGKLQQLTISWHGGEPLLAPHVIEQLSQSFIRSCDQHGVLYGAEISTNGYYLSRERFEQLLDWRVERFMVTLDGSEEVHDARRGLHGGGGTFRRIVDNLLSLKDVQRPFEINLRVNFDNSNLEAVTDFIPQLTEWFADDPRFKVFFRPVGCMGGENDLNLSVCDDRTKDRKIWEFNEAAIAQGLTVSSFISDILLPTGAICYAAKPNSLIVGSDGKLYKCSVAIDQENNQLGQIHGDGSMELDLDKMALWTTSGEETDAKCQACFFRPACQGNHCPLYRMRTGNRPCSYEKRQIKRTLRTLWLQSQSEEVK